MTKLKRRNEFAEKPTKHERPQLKILKIEICYDICLMLRLNKFSNIGRTMHCCQMSKADAGHVDFLIRTKLIRL
jgi:hypothetical protein